MSERVLPNVIPHPPHDHRQVEASELLALKLYDHLMGRPFWTIVDYVSAPNFLKSTSKWSEQHLIAFRCLLLEHLPVSRIVPISELVGDDDPSMKLVDEHLLATERDVRSGDAERRLGPASSFYQQLQAVIRRPPSPPEPIAIPRVYRPTTLSTGFAAIPESHGSTTSDESYEPSPPTRQPASPLRHSGEGSDTRPRNSMESIRSQDSTTEDKLEELANQAAATLLGLLCTFQELGFPDDTKRLRFRCLRLLVILTYPAVSHLFRPLLFMGKLFQVTTMVATFSSDVVAVDYMNGWFRILILGLLWKYFPIILLRYFKLIMCTSVSGRNTLAKSLFKPKN